MPTQILSQAKGKKNKSYLANKQSLFSEAEKKRLSMILSTAPIPHDNKNTLKSSQLSLKYYRNHTKMKNTTLPYKSYKYYA